MPDDLHLPVAPESAAPAAEPAVAPSAAAPFGPQPPARHTVRIAIVVGGVIGALVLSLAFAPVRTLAVQMLEIFRVQKIATVAITSDDLDKIGRALENGDPHVSLEELGDMWIDGSPTSGSAEPEGTTLSAAQASVDFPVRIPAGVDGTRTVLVDPGGTVKFKLHVDKVNELLRYYGATKVFSSSLEGKTFAIKTPPTVYLAYGKDKFEPSATAEESKGTTPSATFDPDRDYVFVLQTRGPELAVPSGVNPLEIRDVLINLPFLPQSIRNQLAGVSDWQHTLLVPSISGSTRDITVAGHPGVLITVPEGEPYVEGEDPDAMMADPDAKLTPATPRGESGKVAETFQTPVAVMWQQDGVLRAVISTSEKRSLQIAESMVR
jgi:hypothetical protein